MALSEREKYLVDLYKCNLQKTTNAKYVYAYRLCYSDKNQTYYYLIHATHNIQGITFMKDSFASVNNGRVEYLGKHQDSISLTDYSIHPNTLQQIKYTWSVNLEGPGTAGFADRTEKSVSDSSSARSAKYADIAAPF